MSVALHHFIICTTVFFATATAMVPTPLAAEPKAAETKTSAAKVSEATTPEPTIVWHTDYAEAMGLAEKQHKRMFLFFYVGEQDKLCQSFERKVLDAAEVEKGLADYVCARLSVDAKIRVKGKEVVVLENGAFAGMKGRPGVAVLDYTLLGAPYHGRVVSAMPFSDDHFWSVRQMKILLALPSGMPEVRSRQFALRCQATAASDKSPSGKNESTIATTEQTPTDSNGTDENDEPVYWLADYAEAVELAQQRGKMLLVYFCDPGEHEYCNRFQRETLFDPKVQRRLHDYVCVQVSLDTMMLSEGKQVKLLDHPSMREMLGRPGVAIVDFASNDPRLRGKVVSTFPLTRKLWYDAQKMLVILDLPAGTLTQRTLIYAVRIHPDHPRSTEGQINDYLLSEAKKHSQHQARIRLQGHHNWESRFHQISSHLPAGLSACEVCAESWPGEYLVEAAIECVRCWRFSSGHWSAVRAYHRLYGYDMRRGSNGIWYATGIFGRSAY